MNLRKRLGNSNIKIIAKIENKEGIDNIEEIIKYADGVMVARGDLGVELSPEKVPLAQKHIIKMCNEEGKLVIVATQMLESMINNPNPTRAEISDVANAVLDGSDCVMLSAETAIGKYPVRAVEFMTKATVNVEAEVIPTTDKEDPCSPKKPSISRVIASSVSELCRRLPITKIICLTYSGHTATQIAKFRIDLPLITVTKSSQVKRQLMLYYAVRSHNMKINFKDPDSVKILTKLYKEKKIEKDDLVLFTAGLHTLHEKRTNTIQIHRISDIYAYSKKKERERKRKE